MSKPLMLYSCTECDAQFPKWSGRCLECSAWGSIHEGIATTKNKMLRASVPPATPIALEAIAHDETPRTKTGIAEFDQVLGGGIVPGSLILLGGEPGIGKSSLMLAISMELARHDLTVLYASGEESGRQVKLRYERFKITSDTTYKHLLFLSETDADTLCATIAAIKPTLAIVDSIQTLYASDIPSETGSVAQVRACTVKLLAIAKEHGIPIIIAGHVTKEGMVAGPKTLEHLVDAVLYIEGDSNHQFRIVKTVKNRFGSTNELGIFEMTACGLSEVKNPSSLFGMDMNSAGPGNTATIVIEGSRAYMVHVQALTTKTYFGYPQRRAVGFDTNRLQLLIAVLSKRIGIHLGDQDIHLNIAGGFKVTEPAADLAVCAAIISAYRDAPIPTPNFIIGEVGLSGEIRAVSHIDKRLKEGEKFGFASAIVPNQKIEKTSLVLAKVRALPELDESIRA